MEGVDNRRKVAPLDIDGSWGTLLGAVGWRGRRSPRRRKGWRGGPSEGQRP